METIATVIAKSTDLALAGWLSWLEDCPMHQRLWVQFPVGEHTLVVGSIPGQVCICLLYTSDAADDWLVV